MCTGRVNSARCCFCLFVCIIMDLKGCGCNSSLIKHSEQTGMVQAMIVPDLKTLPSWELTDPPKKQYLYTYIYIYISKMIYLVQRWDMLVPWR